MTRYWEPGTQYNNGDTVEYEGATYKIIQPHRSQSDWAPPITPALWGKVSHGEHHNNQGGGHHAPQHHEQHHPAQQQYHDEKHGGNQYQPQAQQPMQVQPAPQDHKKSWWDMSDEQKKHLEIGGGLLAGAAAIGAGYYAYKEHEKSEEEKKALTYAMSNWLREAEERTRAFHANGPHGPCAWILNRGKQIPPSAICVGQEHSWSLYIARAFHDGGIQVGKASDAFQKGAVIGYKKEEIHLGTYEILVGDMSGLRWVDMQGKFNPAALGHRPVEGGRENNGVPLYVAKAPYKGFVHPGKIAEGWDGAFIPYGEDEKEVKNYSVLCYL